MIRQYFPRAYLQSVFDIDYRKLYNEGYRGVIFDIDNTLVHHGENSTPLVDDLLRHIQETGLRICMLSNNDEERVKRFLKNVPAAYVCDAAKPDPKGYIQALKLLGIKPEEAVAVGDQIFSDILGANRAGIDSILVKFISFPGEKWIGFRRYLEYAVLFCFRHSHEYKSRLRVESVRTETETSVHKKDSGKSGKKRKLFCEISPLTYKISVEKGIWQRRVKDFLSGIPFAGKKIPEKLPNVVYAKNSGLIKRGPGIDPVLQENKAVNIRLAAEHLNGLLIRPGEVFSFWHTIGRTSERKGYKAGRIIKDDHLIPGIGGGLCNLGNTMHVLALHSPMTITEFHGHSDALAPDEGKHVPFSSGTSVSYNYIDYRFRNDTDQTVQILVWCEGDRMYAELRSEKPYPWNYELEEQDHHFRKEGDKYYRISKIYRNVTERATGKRIRHELILNNHSEVMYDYSLIPEELIVK